MCFLSFRATANKKLREQVAVELSFFNSSIQLLKEELSDLNSKVDIYQHDRFVTRVLKHFKIVLAIRLPRIFQNYTCHNIPLVPSKLKF